MKKIIFISISICFCFLYTSNSNAQTQKFYSTDNGLSNSLINKIFQDSKGFIWIATEWGLNKYDSNKFSVYNNVYSDSTSLKNNYIHTVFEDNSQNLYVGTISGLMKYNREKDNFEDVKMYNNEKLVFPHITSLIEVESGDIWITTSGQSIFILKEGEKKAYFYTELSKYVDFNHVSIIHKDKDQGIWIGSENSGLSYYNAQTKESLTFDAQNTLSSNHISTIVEDKDNNIFVGTLTNGLNIYNKATKNFDLIPYAGRKQLLVKSLFISNSGQLLIGTDGQGLKYYDYASRTIKDYITNSYPFDLSDAKVHSILQDRDNNLWLGLFQKGVVFIPSIENKFKYWGYKIYNENPLGSGCIMSVYKDRAGTTWVGADNEGIYGINSKGQQIAHYSQTSNPNSVSNVILSIFEDTDNNLWLGSYTKGLAKMNKKTGECEYIPHLRDKKVYFITEDNHKNLLIATYGSGLYIMDYKTRNITQHESPVYAEDNLSIDCLSNNWINTILCDKSGLIWIGHYKGLSCYDPKKNTFLNYFDKNNILDKTIVISLMEDHLGKIWIGSTNGLHCFDKRSSTLTDFTTANGLPNDVICGIEEDKDKNIWLSTYHGISKYIPVEHRFANYYVGDGLQGNEFTRGASFCDDKGQMFFGGTNGITFYNPSDINETRKDIKLILTGFFLANKKINLGDKSGRADIIKNGAEMSDFDLSHEDNSFSLEFSSLDYSNSERISYQYMIDELNSEWMSTLVGVNTISYNDLAPGTYHLHVRAFDNKAVSPIKTFTITIRPPWHETWWAYTLYSIFALFAIYGIITYFLSKMRYKQEILKKEHNEAISEAKLQFFINISHEIRTPMTLIINPLQKLLEENENPQIQKTYLIIHRNAQRILRLINQLMDIRKLDKGQMRIKCRETDIIGFIEDLMLTFEYQTKKKNINLNFIHAEEQLKVWIDLNNFDKVLLNILSNAFKYTDDGGEIEIKLETNNEDPLQPYFQITVSDTGMGIDDSRIEDIFKRFYQIESTSVNQYSGTGIGLHLSRLLVELHHGIIYAENRKDIQGSRFIIRLPLGKEHLGQEELEIIDSNANYPKNAHTSLTDIMIIDNEIEETKSDVKSKTKHNILIVEDDDEIRNYLKEELSKDYKIKECKNGKEAYELILRNQPDLVISDIMMPEMDGITLCRKLKQNININDIPIILLTAKTRIEDKLEGLEIGADAYLSKPFNSKELNRSINNLISNRARLKAKYTGSQEQSDKVDKIEMKSSDEILLAKVMKVINYNLSNPELNVEMLAQNVGMSRVHMHRKLKELTNQSARDFIKGIRLTQAAALLTEKKLAISDVAYATGFSNLSHFSNSFREFHGMSPKEYMNTKQIENEK